MHLYEIRETDNGWKVFVKENEDDKNFAPMEETFDTEEDAKAFAEENLSEEGDHKKSFKKKYEAKDDDKDDDDKKSDDDKKKSNGNGDDKKKKSNDDDDDDDEDDKDSKKTVINVKEENVELSEEDAKNFLKVLGINEEHYEEAKTIFEAALNERIAKIRNQLQEEAELALEGRVAEIEQKMLDQIDRHLEETVSEWTEENKVGITEEVRFGLTESLVEDVFKVFSKYNIDVPKDKTDLYEKVSTDYNQLVDTYNKLVEETDETVKTLSEELNNFKKAKIVNEVGDGLSEASKERLALMIEDMEFVSEEAFTKKVEVIAEKLFDKKKKPIEEDVTENGKLDEGTLGVKRSENVSPVIAALRSAGR